MNTIFTIKKISPQLRVANLHRAVKFYTGVIGFKVEFLYEDFYVALMKDDYSIHLKLGKTAKNDSEKIQEDLDLIFSVKRIDEVYEKLSSTSTTIIQPLRDMPYGKEFYIADPDGNRIGFIG